MFSKQVIGGDRLREILRCCTFHYFSWLTKTQVSNLEFSNFGYPGLFSIPQMLKLNKSLQFWSQLTDVQAGLVSWYSHYKVTQVSYYLTTAYHNIPAREKMEKNKKSSCECKWKIIFIPLYQVSSLGFILPNIFRVKGIPPIIQTSPDRNYFG